MFVGSLPWSIDDAGLAALFAQAGTVATAQIVKDRETGRSRGFGFVEMSSDEEAQNAVKNLNGTDVEGRKIVVNIARPREDR
ncbi:MAG: RNA-binding protein [Candidatus Daviesbacteria bacterium]|nr:RNA-binding protein [Candidatus Daviesbacteria bacterium]